MISVNTGFFESVDNVRGVMNAVAAGVIKICTSAPAFANKRVSVAILYAAILPETAIIIFLFRMDVCKSIKTFDDRLNKYTSQKIILIIFLAL